MPSENAAFKAVVDTVEHTIYTVLGADATIQAEVGTKLFEGLVPEEVTGKYLVFRLYDTRVHHFVPAAVGGVELWYVVLVGGRELTHDELMAADNRVFELLDGLEAYETPFGVVQKVIFERPITDRDTAQGVMRRARGGVYLFVI